MPIERDGFPSDTWPKIRRLPQIAWFRRINQVNLFGLHMLARVIAHMT